MSDSFHIKIDKLAIGYASGKEQVVLHQDLSYSASKGEMVALIGSNGIGKSTLLRSLIGFQDYFSGDVIINGKSIQSFSARERARMISFVSTDVIQVNNMSVFDLVAYGRFPHTNQFGKLMQDDHKKVLESMANVGLQGFENKPLTQISDGERQRAMIARALAQDTPIIILDEPTAFLDISNKYEIFHLLQVVAREQNKTIVLSTHDLNIALREVDKLWILLKDSTYEGSPEDAVLDGQMDRLFTNQNIGFDAEEGEYFFRKKFREKVKVIGNGIALTWTLKALNRMGFRIVTDANPDFTIHVLDGTPTQWKLEKKGEWNAEFNSIYDMFRYLIQKLF